MSRMVILRRFVRLIPGMGAMVALATVIGITFNGLSPNGLPLVRKPLRETRRFVTAPELLSHSSGPIRRNESSAKALTVAQDNAVSCPASKESSDREGTQKHRSGIKQGPAMNADSHKVASIPMIVRTKESVPVTPNEMHVALDPNVKGPPQQPKKPVQALFTTLDDAKALFDKNAAIFLDGRPAVDYEVEHIQGSVSLFAEDVDNLCGKVLGNVPKDKVIVTYCSDPECVEAMKLADALVAKGFTKVVILLEGLPGWKEAGYPTAKAKESG